MTQTLKNFAEAIDRQCLMGMYHPENEAVYELHIDHHDTLHEHIRQALEEEFGVDLMGEEDGQAVFVDIKVKQLFLDIETLEEDIETSCGDTSDLEKILDSLKQELSEELVDNDSLFKYSEDDW